MEHARSGEDVFVRLDPGEEMHAALQSLSETGIHCAAITSGIGRVHDIRIGYLDGEGVYQTREYADSMELLSTQGNLAPGPDGPFSHIHVVLSDDDHVVQGGHLFHATVHVTAELHLRVLDSGSEAMRRESTASEFMALSFCAVE